MLAAFSLLFLIDAEYMTSTLSLSKVLGKKKKKKKKEKERKTHKDTMKVNSNVRFFMGVLVIEERERKSKWVNEVRN